MRTSYAHTLAICFLLLVLLFLHCSKGPQPMTLEFRLAQLEPGEGLTEMTFAPTGETLYLHDEVLIGNTDIASASAITWQDRQVVDLRFTAEGKEKLARLTGEHVKERVGMLVDGRLLSAPMINAPILEGRAIIDGDFSQEETLRIATGIQAGLPSEQP